MYSFPSTSQIFAPSARSMKKGALPTLRNARTGEFTPPGMRFCAAANNLDESEAMETECKRPTSNIERPTLNSDAGTPHAATLTLDTQPLRSLLAAAG